MMTSGEEYRRRIAAEDEGAPMSGPRVPQMVRDYFNRYDNLRMRYSAGYHRAPVQSMEDWQKVVATQYPHLLGKGVRWSRPGLGVRIPGEVPENLTPSPSRPPSRLPIRHKGDKQTARHESAHAVMVLVNGGTVDEVMIHGASGHC